MNQDRNEKGRQGGRRFGDRDERPSFGGNRNSNSSFGRNRNSNSSFGKNRNSGFKRNNFSSENREMHKAVCSKCGKECEVPFKPTEGKPVYCKDCFMKDRKY